MASGGSGIDVGGEGASSESEGCGDGESNTRGGETDTERQISIVAMQLRRSRINCR